MTTATLTLTDFLLARIAEDEAEARRLADDYPSSTEDGGWFGNADDVDIRVGVGRALAECDAKRQIVAWRGEIIDVDGGLDVLRMIALPYADHPDYDESWRS